MTKYTQIWVLRQAVLARIDSIIDNTHLAVLQGTGDKAVLVPEVIEFTKRYGFNHKCFVYDDSTMESRMYADQARNVMK